MSNKRLCFLLFLATVVSGCKRIEMSELYGNYVAKYPFGIEKMTLKPNGEFIQEVRIKGAEVVINRGTWRYDSENQYLILENALSITDGFGRLKKDYKTPFPGNVHKPAGRLLPWRRIRIGSYEGTLYVKQK